MNPNPYLDIERDADGDTTVFFVGRYTTRLLRPLFCY